MMQNAGSKLDRFGASKFVSWPCQPEREKLPCLGQQVSLGLAKDGAMMQEMRAPNRRSFKPLFVV